MCSADAFESVDVGVLAEPPLARPKWTGTLGTHYASGAQYSHAKTTISTTRRQPTVATFKTTPPSFYTSAKMENERGELVDLYVPRKCSATGRIIKAKDHASVQISVAKVDENGRYTGENQVYALSGFVRAMGESDDSMNRLTQRDGFLKSVWSASR
ncbi:hypothetical protein EKO04_011305 [Ascochyta lentis]|uniref:40S ribosomal protein S21 n=2 Tax=Ascochyta TaxID=5453 RepID=A0A8H7IS86_9PLEO|nr:hypothetical protein EKO04_011305 [Ascochyta lentis]